MTTKISLTVALKLVNLAVKMLLYWTAVKAMAATVPDCVILISLVSASKAVRLFEILVAVSVTVKLLALLDD